MRMSAKTARPLCRIALRRLWRKERYKWRGRWGKYKDVNGKLKLVNGDMTKVRYVPRLSEPAQVLLNNIEHASRKLPGTQETRRLMRFQTQAFRIKHGTPLFITFSPDQSHNLLMTRLSRTRRRDPAFRDSTTAKTKHLSGADAPRLSVRDDDVMLDVSAQGLCDRLPDYDARKQSIATDYLASVGGFRVMIQMTFEHLFGMVVL